MSSFFPSKKRLSLVFSAFVSFHFSFLIILQKVDGLFYTLTFQSTGKHRTFVMIFVTSIFSKRLFYSTLSRSTDFLHRLSRIRKIRKPAYIIQLPYLYALRLSFYKRILHLPSLNLSLHSRFKGNFSFIFFFVNSGI